MVNISKRTNFTRIDTSNNYNRKKINPYSLIPNWCPTSNHANMLPTWNKHRAYTQSHTTTTALSVNNPSAYPARPHSPPSNRNNHYLHGFKMKLWRIKWGGKRSPNKWSSRNKHTLKYWSNSPLDFRLLLTSPMSSDRTIHLLFPFHPIISPIWTIIAIYQMRCLTTASLRYTRRC